MAGGCRNAAFFEPTVVAYVRDGVRVFRDELLGPDVGLTSFGSVDEVIASVRDSNCGLSAAVFTESLDSAIRFAREFDSANIRIDWGTQRRADLMPLAA